jgi:nucleotide-binding universal stress UspA family protein
MKDSSGAMTNPLAGRILFATDFSECAARAWEYVLFLGRTCGARLDILHVLEFQPGMDPDYDVNRMYLEQLRKQAVRQLDELVNLAALSGLSAQGQITQGIPSHQIKEVAQQCDADLVVLATHGRTGLEHILLGSTAERAVRSAPCPVLTVRIAKVQGESKQIEPAAFPISIKHILVPVDFSDCSLEALEYAVQVSEQFKAMVTILHVLEPVAYGLDFTLRHEKEDRQVRERLRSRLSELTHLLAPQGLTAQHVIRGGTPRDSILDCGREGEADLIVMGTHGRRGLSHLIVGSVAEAVLRHAECPVLTVKSPKFKTGHQRVLPEAGARHVQG